MKFLSWRMSWREFIDKNTRSFCSETGWSFLLGMEDALFDSFVLKKNWTYFVAVSTWSDSMYLFYCIFFWAKENNISIWSLCVLHYNHSQRVESSLEQESLSILCWEIWVTCISASYIWSKKKEHRLREARYHFFKSVIGSCVWKGPFYLFLWHHLDDRIETTLLHTIRWCSLRGHLNMMRKQKQWKIRYVRPLLGVSKKQIRTSCQKAWVVFFEDSTNTLQWVSKRNQIRQKIYFCDEYFSTYTHEYALLESVRYQQKKKAPMMCKLQVFHENIVAYYRFSGVVSVSDVESVLQTLWIYVNIWTSLLQEMHGFFQKKSWMFYKKWRLFYCSHASIYAISVINDEWSDLDVCLPVLPLSKNILFQLTQKQRWEREPVWGERSYPKKDMRYKGKKLSKRYINQKIPVFLRKHLPVYLWEWWEITPISWNILHENWYI